MAVRFDRLPDDIVEDEFQQLTLDLFHTLSWDHNFTRRTRGKGGKWVTATSKKGWPDLTLWTPRFGGVLLFRELKTMKGVVSAEQTEVMADLTRAGQNACVWRPSDWDEMVAMATKGPIVWSCGHCGPSPDNSATWCALGCGRDYNRMTKAT